jgi:ubiquinone biosynthesis protein
MSQRMGKDMTQGSILSTLLELKDFVTGLPARVNKILDALSNAELEVKVRALDAKLVMEGLQKIANRITTGIVLAALIIGASLLMRVETTFRIFGYPGLAMLLFLAAAGGGLWLVIRIFEQDRRSEKRASR